MPFSLKPVSSYSESNRKEPSVVNVRMEDRLDGTHAERVEAYPPKVLMTDNDGDYARIRVDVGQTGFFAGREFLTFYEFSILTGQSITIKATALNDVFLQRFLVDLWTADLRVELYAGGTVSGTYNVSLPILRSNTTVGIDTSYTSQTTMTTGGSFTSGTLVDVMQLFAVSNPAKGSAVEGGNDAVLGFIAGNYFIKLININSVTATGVFKARWEERT